MGSYTGEPLSKGFEREELLFRKEYTDREHLITVFGEMKNFLNSDEFCDITLKAENKEIKAHRVILAASSEYFKNMFNARSLAAIAKIIDLPDQRYDSVKNIVDYIYTGRIEINLDTAEELYKTAEFLQMDRVKVVCSHFLKAALSKESCLLVWNIAGNVGLKDLQKEAKKQSVGTIDQILSSGGFLNLSDAKVEDLLKESPENSRADKIYRAIVAWVKHDLEKRRSFLGKLLQYVPPQKITREFLRTTVIKETLLAEDLVCMTWMHQIFVSLFDTDSTELSQEEGELMSRSSGHIYVCSLRGKYSTFYKFDTISAEVTDLPARSRVRYSYPVFYNDAIYFTGGLVKSGCSTQCDRFNLRDESWDAIALDCDRYYHGACVLRDSMYVVGGCRDHQNLKTVKIYDFETGTWTKTAEMTTARKFFGLSKHNGCIYAVGGITDAAASSSSVERFDPREGAWQNMSPLHRISGACSSSVASNLIYCTGFRSGLVERFETRVNKWSNVPDALSLPGCLVSTKGDLYRVSVEGIERFENYTNSWNNTLEVNSFSTEIVAIAN